MSDRRKEIEDAAEKYDGLIRHEFIDGAEWADKTSHLRAELVKAREAINKYKSECETTAPDSLYKRTCREKMFEAIASIDKVLEMKNE